MLSDDEISELAEALWDACAASGRKVVPDDDLVGAGCCCPFGALIPMAPPSWLGDGYPTASTVSARVNITRQDADAFMRGFGSDSRCSSPLELLGRRFREQALSGEGFR